MTSTNIFTGMADSRNSSRVLRPPGGASSNILGGPLPEKTEKKVTNKEPNVPEPKQKEKSPEKKAAPPVNNPPPQGGAPNQRGRVPPGGYSSGGFW